jgi:hypothetical protein
MFNTLLIVGAVGSILISVFVSYKFQSLTVWAVFTTLTAFLLAACLKWQGHMRWVFFSIFFIAILVGCIRWQTFVWNQEIKKTADKKSEYVQQVKKIGTEREKTHSLETHPIVTKSNKKTSHANQTAYSRLSNRELSDEVTKLVLKMRLYLEQKKNQDAKQTDFYKQQMREAKTEQEKKLVLEAETHNTITSPSIDLEYGEKFKTDAIVLRDELLLRLPKNTKKDRNFMYEHPTNLIGVQKIIDDLEILAKSLPA